MGPLGFDLGCLLGVLLLAYIVLRRQPEVSQEEQALEQGQVAHSREQQCCWLLGAICELWRTLDQRFKDLSVAEAAAKRTSDGGGPAEARSAMCLGPHSDSVWRETRQFAAFALIRLTIGMHSYPGYEFLRDATSRTHAELDALRVARGLLDMRADVIDGGAEQNRMEGLTQVVQSIGTS